MPNKDEKNHDCCNDSNQDCNCGHDHANEEETIINLTLEDGSELECDVIGLFEIEEKAYIALLPMEEEEVLLYEYTEIEDGIELEQIESDEEFNLVSEAFNALYVDEEDVEELDKE